MRLAALGLILLCCQVRAIETDDDSLGSSKFTALEDALEKFKTILKTGNDSLGIPVLDPFRMDKFVVQLEEEEIKMHALLQNVMVQGLSEYDVNSGDFKIIGLKIELNLTWPLVVASTQYALQGKASDFEIYGDGNINLAARGFNFAAVIGFTVKGKYLAVKSIESEVSLKELDFKATGIFNDNDLSELLSAVISDMVPQLIDDYQDIVTEKLNIAIQDMLNNFLSDKTLGDLLKLITG